MSRFTHATTLSTNFKVDERTKVKSVEIHGKLWLLTDEYRAGVWAKTSVHVYYPESRNIVDLECSQPPITSSQLISVTAYNEHLYMMRKTGEGADQINILYKLDRYAQWQQVMESKFYTLSQETPIINGKMYLLERNTHRKTVLLKVVSLACGYVETILLKITPTKKWFGELMVRNNELYLIEHFEHNRSISKIVHGVVQELTTDTFQSKKEWLTRTNWCDDCTIYYTDDDRYLDTFNFTTNTWTRSTIESGYRDIDTNEITKCVKIGQSIFSVVKFTDHDNGKCEFKIVETEIVPRLSSTILLKVIDVLKEQKRMEEMEQVKKVLPPLTRCQLESMIEWRLGADQDEEDMEY